MEQITTFRSRLERTVFAPLVRTSNAYYWLVAGLVLVVAWGVYAYIVQLGEGLIATGMRDRISWGLYISLSVFLIAISYGGTLTSAVLRVTQAGWRTPITRMAEFITVAALATGALFIIIDLGRPDRIHHLVLFSRWQSPIMWDVLAISTYLVGSIIYLYVPLIPDLARCRDQLDKHVPEWKRQFFRIASLGWRDTPEQKRLLGIAMNLLMVLIIPVAIMVHSVLSWIFAMTLREPWDSPMFGIYFVIGAIFSGVGMVIIIMAILRRVFKLEEWITRKHFVYLGYLLASLASVMIYFNLSEYLTEGFKVAGEAEFHLNQLFVGELAPLFWTYALAGLVAPLLIILIPWTRTIAGVVAASVLVTLGMWIERYLIVIGGLEVPLMPYEPSTYTPTWVEWSIMTGVLAAFVLVMTLMVKVFPVMAIWEVEEQHEKEAEHS